MTLCETGRQIKMCSAWRHLFPNDCRESKLCSVGWLLYIVILLITSRRGESTFVCMWILTQPLQSRSIYCYSHFADEEIVFASIKISFPHQNSWELDPTCLIHCYVHQKVLKLCPAAYFCISIYLREKVSRERDREGEDLKQTPWWAWNTGLDLTTLSDLSWNQDLDAQPTEPPRHPCLFV